MRMKLSGFAKFAWFVLVYNLIVIVWGAYVRATGSGAGCGSHWPLCNGQVIPPTAQVETLIEFTHRLMSGLALLLALVLIIWAYRAYPKGSSVRLGASLSMFFILTEALVGAGLVLFEWVAHDQSLGRVISMGVHLVNTFLLLASIALTAWWASGGMPVRLRERGAILIWFCIGLFGILLIGISGAITALGDTLFPTASLVAGVKEDFASTAHFLVRLRIWHPVIAILVGSYLLIFSALLKTHHKEVRTNRFVVTLSSLVAVQLLAGLINVILLAPVWMQLVHLLLADLLWITLVLLAANIFSIQSYAEMKQSERPPLGSIHHENQYS